MANKTSKTAIIITIIICTLGIAGGVFLAPTDDSYNENQKELKETREKNDSLAAIVASKDSVYQIAIAELDSMKSNHEIQSSKYEKLKSKYYEMSQYFDTISLDKSINIFTRNIHREDSLQKSKRDFY